MNSESDKHDVTDADCLEVFDHLYSYLNGELDDEKMLARVEHHLGHCRSCFTRSQMERELNERIRKSGKDKMPESLQKRLRDLMQEF